MKELKLIILVGISGSGKSTWLKSIDLTGCVIISPDDIRRELTGSISNQTMNGQVFAIAFSRIVENLEKGNSVIFDATNVTSKSRKTLMNYITEFSDVMPTAYAKIFDANPEISKERVRKDIENGVDRSNVPDYAIDRQYSQLMNDLHLIESDGYTIMV